MGDCTYCGRRAGLLRRKHKRCDEMHRQGVERMTALAKDAATAELDLPALRERLAEVAAHSFARDEHVTAAIEKGWELAVAESLSDGVLTQQEESRLRGFRDRLALQTDAGERTLARLDKAAQDRLVGDARKAAVATDDGARLLDDVAAALDRADLSSQDRVSVLARAWEEAVDGALEDGVLALDEEAALVRYLRRFELDAAAVNRQGAHANMVKAGMIREAAEGVVPQRLTFDGPVPFNLMKSEQLVWLIEDVDYHEVVTRRQRRGTSHGLSIRVAKGLYYRPGMFRSQVHEWEETVHVDTGLLGVTSKHIYFHGGRKRFRIRYDRIVSFDPYQDGIGVMRDAQTAKPQSFRTGDGWFIYNLVTNLARNC